MNKFKYFIFLVGIFSCYSNICRALEKLPDGEIYFTDIGGTKYNSRDFFKKPTIVFFQGQGCPISDKQQKKIDEFSKEYSSQFQILRVELNTENFNGQRPENQIFILDRFKVLARYLRPKTMTEIFLIDDNTVLYRGAIDNQLTLVSSNNSEVVNYLKNAIVEKFDHKEISKPQSNPYGCIVSYEKKAGQVSFEYFNKNVATILQRKCLYCHSAQSGLNFSSYETLSNFKDMIGFVIQNNMMPPWAAEGKNWKNDTRLSKNEKTAIANWVESDDSEIYKRKKDIFLTSETISKNENSNSQLEKIEMLAGKSIIKSHELQGYRYFKIPIGNTEPVWIDYVEIKSKIPELLHHSTIVMRNLFFENAEEGFHSTTGHMLVGTSSVWRYYSFGSTNKGFYIPSNAWLYIEAHYEGSNKDELEEYKIIIHKFKKRPKLGIFTIALNVPFDEIKIPPNTKNIKVEKKLTLDWNERLSIVGVNAHMHSRGDRIVYQLKKKVSGRKIDILRINKYMHKVQRSYFFEKPLIVNKGDELQFAAFYDNTKDNLNNPDFNSFVRGGTTSNEEMGVGTVWLTGRSEFVEKIMKNYVFK